MKPGNVLCLYNKSNIPVPKHPPHCKGPRVCWNRDSHIIWGDHLIACCHIAWPEGQKNRLLTATQITVKSRKAHSYSFILDIVITNSHSGSEIPFRKQQTWTFKSDFSCHVSKGFSRKMVKHIVDLSSVSTQCFD